MLQNQLEKVKPSVIARPRSSTRHCGACGARVYFTDDVCQECLTPIDWSEFERRKEYEREKKRKAKLSV